MSRPSSCCFVQRCQSLILLAAALATVGCGREAQRDAAAASMALVSVDTLIESDTLFVGRPQHAIRGPHGQIFVVDGFARRVVEFDTLFRVVRTLGHPGQGPGEFVGPSTLAMWGADTLAVMDLAGQAVNLYRVSTGAFVKRLSTPGVARTVSSTTGGLLLGTLSALHGTAAGLLFPGDSTVRPVIPLPDQLRSNPLGLQVFPSTWVAGLGDSVALLFTTSDRLFLGSIDNDRLSSVPIPATRRGAVPDSVDALLAPVLRSPERLMILPAPAGLLWRPDGLILVWHRRFMPIDEKLSGSFERVDSEVTATAYLTVIDRARRRACVDLEIPTEWAEQPAALFSDSGSFFVLGHSLAPSTTRPTLELRRYAIPLDDCQWTALSPAIES